MFANGGDDGASASTQPTTSAGSRSTSTTAAAPIRFPNSRQSSASSASAADDGGEEPFYDLHADAADATWVERNLNEGRDTAGDGTAVRLACPSCFMLLCVSAQAHVEYAGQWRAVFVRNCSASESDTVRVSVDGEGAKGGEHYRPVACERCRTEVGVLDENDVYHFCNVLS